jgi:hypothetical protein
MDAEQQRKTPKGGRKGGAVYPRIDLKQAHGYAIKLVSKTHTGPQSEKIILPGVFHNSGANGKVKVSALKQYSLLQGEPNAYESTQLAKDINSAPSNEVGSLLQKACLSPNVFKTLFETFHNDTVAIAKIRQQTINLKVHPDSADDCVKIFTDSLVYAGLAQVDQDQVILSTTSKFPEKTETEETQIEEHLENDSKDTDVEHENKDPEFKQTDRRPITPAFHVNISIDSSMDPEKLEKILKVLKQHGAI